MRRPHPALRSRPARAVAAGLCALVLLPATACSGGGGAVTGDDPEALLARGTDLLVAGNAAAALRHFERADELTGGTSAEAALGLAQASFDLGDSARALTEARRVLELAERDRQRAKAHNLVGLAHFAAADRHEVEAQLLQSARFQRLRDARRSEPGRAERDHQRARQEELDRAEEAFRRAVELAGGDDAAVRTNLAEVHLRQGDLDSARETLQPVLPPAGPGTPEAAELDRCLDQLAEYGVAYRADDAETGDTADSRLRPPRKVEAPAPDFPLGVAGGYAVVRSVISPTGELVCAYVLESDDPRLARSALEAARSWRFEPATLDGRPVPVQYFLTVNFRRD